jgi:hypothetical protein
VPSRLLPIYLNDHLAGATLGLELVRRAQRENGGTPLGDFLHGLADEIGEDRRTLLQLMERLGIEPSRSKIAAARVTEKVGRLKLNGQLTGYSPLSRLVELEGLATGIEGKRALWLALAEIADRDERLDRAALETLAERAGSQRERLETHRLQAARDALG